MQENNNKKTLKAVKQALAIFRAEDIGLSEQYLQSYFARRNISINNGVNDSMTLRKKRGNNNGSNDRGTISGRVG